MARSEASKVDKGRVCECVPAFETHAEEQAEPSAAYGSYILIVTVQQRQNPTQYVVLALGRQASHDGCRHDPTAAKAGFVSIILRAGCHVELVGGGHYHAVAGGSELESGRDYGSFPFSSSSTLTSASSSACHTLTLFPRHNRQGPDTLVLTLACNQVGHFTSCRRHRRCLRSPKAPRPASRGSAYQCARTSSTSIACRGVRVKDDEVRGYRGW
jgi:hypothetical protein